MNFLIQTYDGEITHDFSFTLLESIRYCNWLSQTDQIKFMKSDITDHEGLIPVGSVEFVIQYFNRWYGFSPKPINIPPQLIDYKFTGRKVINGNNESFTKKSFVKSNDRIKSFTEICEKAPPGNFQISEIIDIDSEYRCFVYKGELVGLQNYSGDYCLFPDVPKINEMILRFSKAPISYTLDVCINSTGTWIIEVHDFFSCGLYGFSDHRILPYMFSRWFNEKINSNSAI